MSSFPNLEAWGFDPSLLESTDPTTLPARIVRVDRGLLRVVTETGFGFVRNPPPEVAVGDFVQLRETEAPDQLRWLGRLPRRNALHRKAAGRTSKAQVLVANVDFVFIVTAFGPDLSPRRIERYLSLARDAAVHPVLVVNKRDLAREEERETIELVRRNLDCAEISATEDHALGPLEPYLGAQKTIALLGSSGVGKSTLINRLLGARMLETRPVRGTDGTGQHTTTRRELLRLPSGAMVIDTPGLREVGLGTAAEAIGETFEEIAALEAGCRFADCTHQNEPGCAVSAALASGELSIDRLESYRRLQREAAGDARRRNEHERRAHERSLHKMYEKHQREKRRRRGD